MSERERLYIYKRQKICILIDFCARDFFFYNFAEKTVLQKRGIVDETQADVFLNPNYARDFHDIFLMKDMEKACVRLYEAVDAGEKIIIYADYDCDGIPGAVILTDLFKLLGVPVEV